MNPESAYECAVCGGIFEDFEEAANCCGDSYYELILCGECGTDYSTEHEAEQCCREEENKQ